MGLLNNPTVRISNIPHTAVAKELLEFLESITGPGSVFALQIFTERQNWKSRGFGRVQFVTLDAKAKAQSLSLQDRLVFKSHYLKITESSDDIVFRPANARNRVDNGILHAGFMVKENCTSVLDSWEGVRGWIMPERERVEFWVWQGKECYKLEILFQDILETKGYFLEEGKLNALLLKYYLKHLGVEDEVFEVLQQDQLSLLGKMLNNREAALNVLESLSSADSKNILVEMLHHGYEANIEPYLSMMLRAFYEHQLSDLKSRCRILVPKGRILIGCLDETGVLNYGQVYVRITMTKSKLRCGDESLRKVGESTCVIVGKVVVTKNPCLHPGDIRVLDAIYDVESEENGLRDCLVFPQKGPRPHPNECSGGDLDGDLYFISWDEGLIPCKTVASMYCSRRPRIMDHEVTLKEIQQFFVDYMINDTLGAISTAHLVHADREPEKAMSRKCLALAELHSMAVDFAKTGNPAEMPRALKPWEFPDFMERVGKPMYVSKGVLGKLYRTRVELILQERSNSDWSSEKLAEAYDHELEVDGFEDFLEVAKFHRDMYADKMRSLMNYYGAETEDELLTGNLRIHASYLQRDNRRYGDMKDRILLSVKNLQHEAKHWFDSSCQPHEKMQMAGAWYHVTYHPPYNVEGSPFLSFPWILGDILLHIKSRKEKKLGVNSS